MSNVPDDLQERIAAYIDGQLTASEAARLEVFLANTDPSLAKQVIDMIATKGALRMAPKPMAPRDLSARVMEQIERASLLHNVEQISTPQRSWWRAKGPLAAGLALVLGGFTYFIVSTVVSPSNQHWRERVAMTPLATGDAALHQAEEKRGAELARERRKDDGAPTEGQEAIDKKFEGSQLAAGGGGVGGAVADREGMRLKPGSPAAAPMMPGKMGASDEARAAGLPPAVTAAAPSSAMPAASPVTSLATPPVAAQSQSVAAGNAGFEATGNTGVTTVAGAANGQTLAATGQGLSKAGDGDVARQGENVETSPRMVASGGSMRTEGSTGGVGGFGGGGFGGGAGGRGGRGRGGGGGAGGGRGVAMQPAVPVRGVAPETALALVLRDSGDQPVLLSFVTRDAAEYARLTGTLQTYAAANGKEGAKLKEAARGNYYNLDNNYRQNTAPAAGVLPGNNVVSNGGMNNGLFGGANQAGAVGNRASDNEALYQNQNQDALNAQRALQTITDSPSQAVSNLQVSQAGAGGNAPVRILLKTEQLDALVSQYPVGVIARGATAHVFAAQAGEAQVATADARYREELMRRARTLEIGGNETPRQMAEASRRDAGVKDTNDQGGATGAIQGTGPTVASKAAGQGQFANDAAAAPAAVQKAVNAPAPEFVECVVTIEPPPATPRAAPTTRPGPPLP